MAPSLHSDRDQAAMSHMLCIAVVLVGWGLAEHCGSAAWIKSGR